MKYNPKTETFRVVDLDGADVTEKYLPFAGKELKEASKTNFNIRKPSITDKFYDIARVRGYYKMMTGDTEWIADRHIVWSDKLIHSEKRPRIMGIKIPNKDLWLIPNWDWNGHNAKIEDCREAD